MIDLDGRDRRRPAAVRRWAQPRLRRLPGPAAAGRRRSVAPLREAIATSTGTRAPSTSWRHCPSSLPGRRTACRDVTALEPIAHQSTPHSPGALLGWRCSRPSARRGPPCSWPTTWPATYDGSPRHRQHVLALRRGPGSGLGTKRPPVRPLAPYHDQVPATALLARSIRHPRRWPRPRRVQVALDCFAEGGRGQQAHPGAVLPGPHPRGGPACCSASPARGHRAGDRPLESALALARAMAARVAGSRRPPGSPRPGPIHRLPVRLAPPHWPVRGPAGRVDHIPPRERRRWRAPAGWSSSPATRHGQEHAGRVAAERARAGGAGRARPLRRGLRVPYHPFVEAVGQLVEHLPDAALDAVGDRPWPSWGPARAAVARPAPGIAVPRPPTRNRALSAHEARAGAEGDDMPQHTVMARWPKWSSSMLRLASSARHSRRRVMSR